MLQNGNNAEVAFSPDGIERMNQNIISLNDGKFHQPIYKVRLFKKGGKFSVGSGRNIKYVEAAEGTNLFFAVYEQKYIDELTGDTINNRTFDSIPLNVVIERQKKGLSSAPKDKDGNLPTFVLSPNDLVYLPTEEERKNGTIVEPLNKGRIYKMVSCTENRAFFIPVNIASMIVDKFEYYSKNKIELDDEGISIKKYCIPLKVNRIGLVDFR